MIQVENLTKYYGKHKALNNINFKVNEGEILGFLGPNGAGKTTAMNIMTGYISSNEGNVTINGFNILQEPEKAKKHIGYLPDTPPLYNEMIVSEYLNFVCDIKFIKKSKRKEMLNEILKICQIEDISNRLIKNLSKGYRQRVGLAQALVGFPEVLILDEPTIGLDPAQIIEMRNSIKNLGKKHTIILSSHILSEVSAVCDRIIIINNGEILAEGTPENISLENNTSNKILLRIKGEKYEIENAFKNNNLIKNIDIVNSCENDAYDISIESAENQDIRENIFYILSKNNLPILMMKSEALSLEEIFLKVINGEYNNNLDVEENNQIDNESDKENINENKEENI